MLTEHQDLSLCFRSWVGRRNVANPDVQINDNPCSPVSLRWETAGTPQQGLWGLTNAPLAPPPILLVLAYLQEQNKHKQGDTINLLTRAPRPPKHLAQHNLMVSQHTYFKPQRNFWEKLSGKRALPPPTSSHFPQEPFPWLSACTTCPSAYLCLPVSPKWELLERAQILEADSSGFETTFTDYLHGPEQIPSLLWACFLICKPHNVGIQHLEGTH